MGMYLHICNRSVYANYVSNDQVIVVQSVPHITCYIDSPDLFDLIFVLPFRSRNHFLYLTLIHVMSALRHGWNITSVIAEAK